MDEIFRIPVKRYRRLVYFVSKIHEFYCAAEEGGGGQGGGKVYAAYLRGLLWSISISTKVSRKVFAGDYFFYSLARITFVK